MSSKQFSTLLVQDGVVPIHKVEEAFQRQILFGGRLGTNLLEIGALDERTLLAYLARASGLPWAGRTLLECRDRKALALLSLDEIRAERLLPIVVVEGVVKVLVIDPLEESKRDKLAARLGRTVEQYITSELRFYALMHDLYDEPLDKRYASMLARFPLDGAPDAEVKLSDDGWGALEQQALADWSLEAESGVGHRVPDRAATSEREAPRSATPLAEPEPSRRDDRSPAEAPPTVDLGAGPALGGALPPRHELADSSTYGQTLRETGKPEAAPAPANSAVPAAAVLHPRRGSKIRHHGSHKPLDLEQFTDLALHSSSRIDLAALFARLGATLLKRCVVLFLRDGALHASAAEGEPLGSVELDSVTVQPRAGSDLGQVCAGSSYYQGPADVVELSSLYKQLHWRTPLETIAVPLKAGEAVVGVALLDEGDKPLPVELNTVFKAVYRLGEALQRLSFERKHRLGTPEAPPSDAEPSKPELLLLDVEAEPLEPEPLEPEPLEPEPLEPEPLEPEPLEPELLEPEPLEAELLEPELLEGELVDDEPPPSRNAAPIARPKSSPEELAFIDDALELVTDAEPEPVPPPSASRVPAAESGGVADLGHDESDLRFWVSKLDSHDARMAEKARRLLLQPSPANCQALLAVFPGRLQIDRFHFEKDMPPASRHSRLLACVVAQGALAVDNLVELADGQSAEERFYALLTLIELRAEGVLRKLWRRVYDKDAQVRMLAASFIRARSRETDYREVIELIADGAGHDDERHAELSLNALARIRELQSLAAVANQVESPKRRVAEAALAAVVAIGLNDFGASTRRWLRWIEENPAPRRLVLIGEAMMHNERHVRVAAAEELADFPQLMLNYHPDAQRRDRARAREALIEWAAAHPDVAARSSLGSALSRTIRGVGKLGS